MSPLILLISLPLLTGLADRTHKHKLIMSLSLLVGVIGLILLPFLETFILVFSLTILTTIFMAPVSSFASNATMSMLGDKKNLFSRIRLGGTLGFSIAASVGGTIVEKHGIKIAFWTAAAIFFVAFLVSLKFVHGIKDRSKQEREGRVIDLLKNPHFLLFLLLGFTGALANTTINTYLFAYMKSLGARESIMGLALTIGTITEWPVLFFVSHFIKKYKVYTLVIFSTVITCVRFLLLALTTNPINVLFIQLLNGFTFPLLSVAGVTYVAEHAPQGYGATSQGLLNLVMGGIGFSVGGFVGGLLLDGLGPRGMYFVFFVFIALVLVFVSIMHRVLPPAKEVDQVTQ